MNADDEILAREAELVRAQLTSDAETLDRLLDDRLLFTNIDGTLATKSDDLALHRSGRLKVMQMDPIERSILHLGDVSVVSVKMNAAAMFDGTPMNNMLRYTRVWQKRSGEWRIVAGHLSIVPA